MELCGLLHLQFLVSAVFIWVTSVCVHASSPQIECSFLQAVGHILPICRPHAAPISAFRKGGPRQTFLFHPQLLPSFGRTSPWRRLPSPTAVLLCSDQYKENPERHTKAFVGIKVLASNTSWLWGLWLHHFLFRVPTLAFLQC